MMDQLISRFPAQLKEALEIGEGAVINPHNQAINKVYVAGLGGSGIGGDFVAEFVSSSCSIPYLVGKGYDIPNYIDSNTLAITSSYSGNTEETLNAFKQLKLTGAKIVVISSGGQLIELAKEHGYDYITIPDDWPSPRACLGYSLIQQLYILNNLGFIEADFKDSIRSCIDLLTYDADQIKKDAKDIASKLFGKIPIIYTTDRSEAVAVRLRQQINENSKMLCWHHVIPEMNHNELVGWRIEDEKWAVLYLRNHDDLKRNQIRIEINKEIIKKYSSTVIEVFSKGNTLIEKSLYLVHLGDWISWYLAELRGVDAIEVKVIDYLKSELKKV